MGGVTKMRTEDSWNKFIERADNFHWNSKQVKQNMVEDRMLLEPICICKDSMIAEMDKSQKQNRKEFLNAFFNEFSYKIQFIPFNNDLPLYDNVYAACYFISLCMFMHNTTRIKGKSIANFITEYSPEQNETILSYVTPTFRKQRHRLLSSRPVYDKRPEWSAFSKSSEHEWSFKYKLEKLESTNRTIPDTFKRLGNLYNDVNTVLRDSNLQDSKYDNNKIKEAYKKFTSKLEKIKYQNYLDLVKVVFAHFFENDKYYGINLYRIEKELKPYITTYEVNQLLACKTVDEKNVFLKKSAFLNSICFPKVYNDLSVLSSSDIWKHSLHFNQLMNGVTLVNCLILDELVENGYLGEDWYDFLCSTTKEMAKEIFYDPNDINYTVTPKSQDSFMKIFSAAIQFEIYKKFGIILS